MDDSARFIAEGLRKAIQGESDGFFFYQTAAQKTSDPRGREVFGALADEERKHKEYLEKQYKSVIDTGAIDFSVRLGPRMSFDKLSPIFTPQLRERVKDAHFEMSALSIGMQIEMNSINLYRSLADGTEDPQVKEFFLELVDWEKGHYEALSRQQEMLKEDYWAGGGFAPF